MVTNMHCEEIFKLPIFFVEAKISLSERQSLFRSFIPNKRKNGSSVIFNPKILLTLSESC